ncbi:unnamed protein product [Cercospora beticola]|nr:unnamed protein product [Cercospora beticola]
MAFTSSCSLVEASMKQLSRALINNARHTTRSFATSRSRYTNAYPALSTKAHASISDILAQNVASGNHRVTAVQCTILDSPVLDTSLGSARHSQTDLEDTRLGNTKIKLATSGIPERLVKVQAMVEMVVKAKEIGVSEEITSMDI